MDRPLLGRGVGKRELKPRERIPTSRETQNPILVLPVPQVFCGFAGAYRLDIADQMWCN